MYYLYVLLRVETSLIFYECFFVLNAIMKTMCPPSYHHNGFVATHALGHMMYVYTLLVPINQRVLRNLSKEHNISGHKSSHKSHRSKMSKISHCGGDWEGKLFS